VTSLQVRRVSEQLNGSREAYRLTGSSLLI
jgi:hypothetical protein